MIHARVDYNRIQDPALENPSLLAGNSKPIASDEPVFLLRAGDLTAAALVDAWADLNEGLGGDIHAIAMARAHAIKMRAWPLRKLADVPKGV